MTNGWGGGGYYRAVVVEKKKQCSACWLFKPLWAFRSYRRGPEKPVVQRARCRECENAANRARYKEAHPRYRSTLVPHTEEGRLCLGCGVFKVWGRFGLKTRGFLGRDSMCRDCVNARVAVYRARVRSEARLERLAAQIFGSSG